MKKILPYKIPPIETYQNDAFFLGICLSYNRSKYVYLNRYINLQCEDTVHMKKLDMKFVHSSWGDLYLEGTGELNLFHFANFNTSSLISFFRERIDQDCYLLLYEIDEFYLSYSDSYKKQHYMHDTYIYGYDDDFFYVIAYSNKKLQQLKVPQKEIANGVLKTTIKDVDDFCSFRINQAADIRLDVKHIIKELENYCTGKTDYENTSLIYGINIYPIVIKCLHELKNKFDETAVDLRIFRLIWEQKKVMCERVEILKKEGIEVDKEIQQKLLDIERRAYIAFQLFFKYTIEVNHSFDKLNKIESIYADFLMHEKELYLSLIKELNKVII